MKRTIIKHGNSIALTIPPVFLELINIKAGDKINIIISDNHQELIIRKIKD